MSSGPKISICVPVYNRLELTLRALDSIKNQTVKPFEVIVIDDSTDDMRPVKEFCKNNKYRYLKNNKNLGLMNNINKTISLSRGDIWCVLHNDDYLSPLYIEECHRIIGKYPKFNIWVTNGCAVDINDKVIGEYRLFKEDITIKRKKGLEILYKKGYYTLLSIIGSTIYRRKFIEEHPFDNAWGNEADLDAALKFLSSEDIKYIDIPIYFTRIHSQQESSKLKQGNEKLKLYINNRLSIYRKYESKFNIGKLEYPALSVHALQLIKKYHYSLSKTAKLLDLSIYDKLRLIWEIPKFISLQIIQKINFYTHKNEIKKFISNDISEKYDHINGYLVDLIAKSGKNNPKILDVGCWAGSLGRGLKKIGYKCKMDGVDIDASNLIYANKESGYYKTFHQDLNRGLELKGKYDIIVFGDVLEHLMNPALLLNSIKNNISDNGKIFISLPNIGFIKYRLLHLFGKWNYTETGIMDRTHVRFFTLKTMRQLFIDNGYVIKMEAGNANVPNHYFYFRTLARLYPSLFALQISFVIVKAQ